MCLLFQKVQQVEFGYRYQDRGLSFSASPFYSKLNKVGDSQAFANADGSSYTPPTLYATLETYGIELEGDMQLTSQLRLHSSVTIQNPKSKDFRYWVANEPGEADDTVAAVPNGDADNNPKLMANTTLNYEPLEQFSTFVTWRYMGRRAANRFNTFYLPAFNEFDLGAAWKPTERLTINLNVNNVFNEKGIMSWAPAGGFLSSIDRQAFTPAQRAADPNQTFSVLTSQPRAYFASATFSSDPCGAAEVEQHEQSHRLSCCWRLRLPRRGLTQRLHRRPISSNGDFTRHPIRHDRVCGGIG